MQHTNYATNLETPRLLGADVQRIELRLEHVLTIRATLTNTGSSRYLLAQLLVGMAVRDDADGRLWFTWRWSRECHETRSPFTRGVLCVENRSGRSTQEHLPLVFAGRRGFGEWSGEVRGLHPPPMAHGQRAVLFGGLSTLAALGAACWQPATASNIGIRTKWRIGCLLEIESLTNRPKTLRQANRHLYRTSNHGSFRALRRNRA